MRGRTIQDNRTNMKLITQRDQIRTIAERWKGQYCRRAFSPAANKVIDFWSRVYICDSTEEVYKKLAALDVETATPADIDAIIGNDFWGKLGYHCNECDAEPPDAILQVGEEPDYESRTAFLCRDCAAKVGNAFPPQAGSVNNEQKGA